MSLHKSYSFKLESHVIGHGEELPQMLTSFLIHYSYDPMISNSIHLQQIYMCNHGKVIEMPSAVFSERFKKSLKKQILIENHY